MKRLQEVKLYSWNVNGIRSVQKKGFEDFVRSHDPDILCLQEVKAHPNQVNLEMKNYAAYWNSAVRPGYSGTLVLTKQPPITCTQGIGIKKHDNEGRVQTLEFKSFFLVNCYTPNAKRDLSRLSYRQKQWDVLFAKYLKDLETEKPVVFCGDLNVAHQPIDLANPKSNKRNAGFTDEEREGFFRLMELGFLDTFREFEKGGGHYTWWSFRPGVREKNIGWRIDYFCVSESLRSSLLGAAIHPDVFGSDHCPVSLKMRADFR